MALIHETSEVKHIDYGTTVGYTVVGSPTISNGVASGFSSSDYLTVSQGSTVTSLEINIAANNIPSSIAQQKALATFYGNINFRIFVNTSGKVQASYKGSDGNTKNFVATNYYTNGQFKITLGSEGGKIYFSQNGQSFSLEGEQTATPDTITFTGLNIGYISSTIAGFTGSIDLNNTYIKVNGHLWFYKPCTNYLIRKDPTSQEEKLVFADSNLYLSGQNNYTVVGSPTIVDGVLIHPTDKQNTIATSETLNVGDSSWEMQYKLLNPTNRNTFLFRINGSTNTRVTISQTYGLNMFLNYPVSSTRADVSSLATVWNDAIATQASQFYWKIYCSGKKANNEYDITVSCGTNLSNLTSETVTISYALASGTLQISSYGSYVQGQDPYYDIDLKETYIKVDGQLWFYGKNYASANIAPVPAGFTYGNTTTPSIGWVDMRDQSFHAAPEGTGYCEVPTPPAPAVPVYNVGTPSFVMKFDGSFDYYSDGNITAQKVGTPALTTGGAWNAGALDKTYNADPTVINAIQLNINKSYWQTANQALFIEFWANLDNTTDLTQPQDFLGNMEMTNSGVYWDGWRFVWSSLRQTIDVEYAVNTGSYTRDYDRLDSTQKTAWNANISAGNWCHYGMYVKPADPLANSIGFVMANGQMHYMWTNTGIGIANSNGGQNNILIANGKSGTTSLYYNGDGKYKTGCATLSPMGEVRILVGQNADDYLAAIKASNPVNGLYPYTVPTGSFATGSLTKYTAS